METDDVGYPQDDSASCCFVAGLMAFAVSVPWAPDVDVWTGPVVDDVIDKLGYAIPIECAAVTVDRTQCEQCSGGR